MSNFTMRSNNYALVCSHYKELLSEHYTWTFGDTSQKHNVNQLVLSRYLKTDLLSVLDLGCGSGFQSIPLLKLAFDVTAVDLSPNLLKELRDEAQARHLDITKLITIQGDLLDFPNLVTKQSFGAIICMGDTLTHLASLEEVITLIKNSYNYLEPCGVFILQFRDLTRPLEGTDRFIPVRSDERTVFTCFLEWDGLPIEPDGSGCTIKVHDLVHVKKGIGAWELCKSWKLGLTGPYVISVLERNGFVIKDAVNDLGMVTLVATKSELAA